MRSHPLYYMHIIGDINIFCVHEERREDKRPRSLRASHARQCMGRGQSGLANGKDGPSMALIVRASQVLSSARSVWVHSVCLVRGVPCGVYVCVCV